MKARTSATTLTRRELNRATLARQMLLARERIKASKAIERLVGMQAQLPRPPFVGLWSRLDGFRREDLIRLLQRREVVRATLMRATLHYMTARDYLALRGPLQPALSQGMKTVLRYRAAGFELDHLLNAARPLFRERPRTFDELRGLVAKQFPRADARAMGYAVRTHLPLVQVPADDATWGFPGTSAFADAESWLGRPPSAEVKPHALVLRYLAAFGPATPSDMQTWSALPSPRDAFEELRPKLRTFHDERGRELFDLPKAPRPPARTPAPVRFVPDYDNLILSHADRTRLVAEEHRPALATRNLQIPATLLVDGFVAGTWRIERKKAAATLAVQPFDALPVRARDELTEEGKRLLRFVEEDARTFEVRVAKA